MSTSEIPDSLADRVAWVVEAPDQQELRRRYDLWASQYDADVDRAEDYLAPFATAEVAKSFLAKSDRILDAGAGTGLSGAALKAADFEHLVAADFSPGMLEIAAKKGVYEEILQADLSKPTSLAADGFDAVVTVGTTSQIPAACLREFVRIVRPGGRIISAVWPQAFEERGYGAIRRDLEQEGRLALVHKGQPFQAMPASEPDMWCQVWVFDVLR